MSDTVTIANKRFYIVPDRPKVFLPSVTTIIGSMSDKSGLEEWRKRVGEQQADKISRFSANRGTLMHTYIEKYLTNPAQEKKDRLLQTLREVSDYAKENGFTKEELDVGRKLFYNFYMNGNFDTMKEIVLQEQMLYSFNGGGYAGRVDNIHKNLSDSIIITDFKTSRKIKKEEWIEGYKLQISAYYVAFWELFGVKPSHGEIWISNEEDSVPQIFPVSSSEIREYYGKFLKMVKAFHGKFGHEVNEYITYENQNL
jgi:hypothetical protein